MFNKQQGVVFSLTHNSSVKVLSLLINAMLHHQVAESYSLDDQFMFGPAMLVAPVMEPGVSSRDVFLPDSERWYEAHTGAEVSHHSGWLSSSNRTTHKVSPAVVNSPRPLLPHACSFGGVLECCSVVHQKSHAKLSRQTCSPASWGDAQMLDFTAYFVCTTC